jgi:hypothetical protein
VGSDDVPLILRTSNSVMSVHGDSPSRLYMLSDCGFLALIVILSVIFYINRLGFYYDDWAVLATMDLAEDQSADALFTRMITDVPPTMGRPVQVLHFVVLYKLFGLKPLGYHIANVLCFVANALLFYLCLLELRFSRLLALAVPLVYIFLPHYSTDRFWFATFVTPLAMALYFVSLYFDLRAIGARRWRFTWKAGSIAALLGSSLGYETTLGLFLINPFLVWYRQRRYQTASEGQRKGRTALFILYGSNPVIVVLIFVLKVILVQRDDPTLPNGDLVHYYMRMAYRVIKPVWREWDFGFNIWGFLGVDIIDRGLKLPLLALEALVQRYIEWPQLVVTGSLGMLTSLYLYHAASQERAWLLHRREWVRIVVTGLMVSVAGYAIFFIVPNVEFTLAGIQNRVSMSAAAGIAVALVGAIGWTVSNMSGEYLRRGAFASLVALLAASGCLVDSAIASFWTAAFQREGMVMAAIRNHFRTLPEGSTLILDGICPTVGPAIVFASSWDLTGALQLMYRDRTLRANVVPGLERQGDLVQGARDPKGHSQNPPPKLKVTPDGVEMITSGYLARYPYGPGLIIYNIAQDTDGRIGDQQAAEDYFRNIRSNLNNCPAINESVGVPIF